ncbi:MAG: anaerobic ribonucleoside-triphosphate reductase activating protein [Candidatus Heimdallarchaeota archaeon]|nr:anaerobic ribonucleoside-triphosphate reductase activating protein [Candidatus Heimdallarchaeota archaeon]MCK5049346.1 anaerobic ribonucleoside-triphosphate reductase activating protein [Candidatus Heimdallarchaeota archaeon]
MFLSGFNKRSLIDFPGNISSVVFTSGCNLECGFCHNYSLISHNIDPDSLVSWDSILIYLKKYHDWLDGVVITGGEPLLHKETEQLLRDIKELNLKTKLDTNGTFPEFLQKLLDEELLDYVAIDLKTSWDKYHLLGASEKQIEKIQETIQICNKYVNKNNKQPLAKIELRTTMVPSLVSWDNFDEILEIVPEKVLLALQQYNPEGAWQEEYLTQKYSSNELIKFHSYAQNKINTVLRKEIT